MNNLKSLSTVQQFQKIVKQFQKIMCMHMYEQLKEPQYSTANTDPFCKQG